MTRTAWRDCESDPPPAPGEYLVWGVVGWGLPHYQIAEYFRWPSGAEWRVRDLCDNAETRKPSEMAGLVWAPLPEPPGVKPGRRGKPARGRK